jgi:hypothetical protein
VLWRFARSLGLFVRAGGTLPLGRYAFVVDGQDLRH